MRVRPSFLHARAPWLLRETASTGCAAPVHAFREHRSQTLVHETLVLQKHSIIRLRPRWPRLCCLFTVHVSRERAPAHCRAVRPHRFSLECLPQATDTAAARRFKTAYQRPFSSRLSSAGSLHSDFSKSGVLTSYRRKSESRRSPDVRKSKSGGGTQSPCRAVQKLNSCFLEDEQSGVTRSTSRSMFFESRYTNHRALTRKYTRAHLNRGNY